MSIKLSSPSILNFYGYGELNWLVLFGLGKGIIIGILQNLSLAMIGKMLLIFL